MVMKILDGDMYDTNIPTYYIEDASELSSIPTEEYQAPAGTIVIQNKTGAFKVYMKDSQGNFNEL